MTEPKGRAPRLPLTLEAIGYGVLGLWLLAWAIVWIAGEMGDAGWWASDPGRTLSGLAFVAALAGIPVVLVGAIVVVLYRSARQVLHATGMVVAEPDPPPALEPDARRPAWRVTLPDGPHIVYIGDDTPSPKRLVCDGRWVELTWPRKRGKPEAAFTVSGHRATLLIAPDLGQTLSAKNWFGIGGVSSLAYRRDLHVDGASVERIDTGATAPRQ